MAQTITIPLTTELPPLSLEVTDDTYALMTVYYQLTEAIRALTTAIRSLK